MQIAYTMAEGRGDTDLVLAELADKLIAAGWRTSGVVQINSDRDCGHRCDMDVRVLPDGPVVRISQDLGREARGCRLDPEALEQSVSLVRERLKAGADVLIVNKFGKHEADGRGFRETIGEALAEGIAVIVGLNAINAAAFADFTDGLAVRLPSEVGALHDWLMQARAA